MDRKLISKAFTVRSCFTADICRILDPRLSVLCLSFSLSADSAGCKSSLNASLLISGLFSCSFSSEINHTALTSLVFSSAALGVRPLRFVLLMKLELQDATDTLDVFLWRDAVSF